MKTATPTRADVCEKCYGTGKVLEGIQWKFNVFRNHRAGKKHYKPCTKCNP